MDSLLAQINEVLGQYTKNVDDRIAQTTSEAAKLAKNELKKTSPKGPKGYAKSWYLKKGKSSKGIVLYTVYNKQYRLTHLLENGHYSKNQYGGPYLVHKSKDKWYPDEKHIQPVNDWIVKEFPVMLEEALKDVD